jgi:broad specificity phosphatase PhoE
VRWLEVRRHSLTKKGPARCRGSHLSADGVALARLVGARLAAEGPPVGYVLTTQSPRTIETALAMGFAVDDATELPGGYDAGVLAHHAQWSWDRPYARYAELIGQEPGLAEVAAAHRAAWLRALTAIGDGGRALVISHGGAIEPALVSCLPGADHGACGAPFAHCDGARLAFDAGSFVGIEFRRAARA